MPTADASGYLKSDGSGNTSWSAVTGPSAGNPTASVGLTAVNGSAATFMRSDGAPALDQTIAPRWTGKHIWQQNNITTTQTDSRVNQNATASTVSVQNQYVPCDHDIGHAWNTSGTPADNYVEFLRQVRTTAGSSPSGSMVWSSRISAAGSGSFTDMMTLSSGAVLSLNGSSAAFSNSQGIAHAEVFGAGSTVSAAESTVVGNGSSSSSQGGTVVGYLCSTTSNFSVVVGRTSSVTATNTIAIGTNVTVSNAGSIVLGRNASDTAANQFVVGGPTLQGGYITDVYIGNGPVHATPQNIVYHGTGGTGTNIAGARVIIAAGISTGSAVPAKVHLQSGALGGSSGTTAQTLVDRLVSGASKVLTNNSAIAIVNCTEANGSTIGGKITYTVEVTDGTDFQVYSGIYVFNGTNKAGTQSNTITLEGTEVQNKTAGTLAVTFAISNANPAVISVNANSSLTPSAGYPRITYSIENLGQQAIAIQ